MVGGALVLGAGSSHFLDFDALRAPEVTFWSIWDGDDLAGCGALIDLDSTLLEVDLVDSTDQDHVLLAGGVDPRDVPSRADNLGNKRGASFVGIGLVLARFRVTLQKVENVLNPICRCRIATMQTGEDVLRLGIASNLVHCPRSTIIAPRGSMDDGARHYAPSGYNLMVWNRSQSCLTSMIVGASASENSSRVSSEWLSLLIAPVG